MAKLPAVITDVHRSEKELREYLTHIITYAPLTPHSNPLQPDHRPHQRRAPIPCPANTATADQRDWWDPCEGLYRCTHFCHISWANAGKAAVPLHPSRHRLSAFAGASGLRCQAAWTHKCGCRLPPEALAKLPTVPIWRD